MDNNLHIVYATDSRYLFATQVAAGSAIAWASRPRNLVIDILDCGVGDNEWQAFAATLHGLGGDCFSLVRHRIDMSAYDDMAEWHTSKGIYARLEIPQILREVAWCVYADGDTLFTDDPFKLETIWDPRYAIMGHLDDAQENRKIWYTNYGLPWDKAHHICAGFILLNLDWFRNNSGTAKCFDIIKQYRPPYNDQDALNLICYGRIGLLPDEWGVFTYLADANTRPGCFHYAANRPWELSKTSRIPMNSMQRIWFMTMTRMFGKSPWRCNKPYYIYVWQCLKTKMWISLYMLANKLPLIKGRYDSLYKDFWPRKKEMEFVPVVG